MCGGGGPWKGLAVAAVLAFGVGCGGGDDISVHVGLTGSGTGICSQLTIRVDTLDLFLGGTNPSGATCRPNTLFLATCTYDESVGPTGKLDIMFSGPSCVIPDRTNLFSCDLHGSLGDIRDETRLIFDDCDNGSPPLCVEENPCVP